MVGIGAFRRKKNTVPAEGIEITFASQAVKDPENHLKKPNAKAAETVTNCCCCGTSLKHPQCVRKLKCSRCHCTIDLAPKTSHYVTKTLNFTMQAFESVVTLCYARYTEDKSRLGTHITKNQLHDAFQPIEVFLEDLFSSVDHLNSFCDSTGAKCKIFDSKTVSHFYTAILQLPTKRPLYKLLINSNNRLKRPQANLNSDESISNLKQLRWILMIFENPLLRESLVFNDDAKPMAPHIRAIQYEIIKRCVGYLALVNAATGKELVTYLQSLSSAHFGSQLDLINLYVTFHFSRILRKRAKAEASLGSPDLDEFCTDVKLNPKKANNDFETIPQMVSKFWNNNRRPDNELPANFKFNVADYGNDWHVRTAAKLEFFYFVANQCKRKCSISRFYNMLSDYLDFKKDFDQWRTKQKRRAPESLLFSLETLDDVVLMPHFLSGLKHPETQFTMCQYPYVLSLGIKISIMEYEIRKAMEHSAEQAFLKALDKKQVVDVYLRVRIRRDHVSQDSLRCIESHHSDLRKSLRVEFINEPGIDAGGLRKEWFSLLTRELFNPDNGLFVVVEESRFSWFNIAYEDVDNGIGHATKLYYLFGVVLGLAIYNGTILDVSFPMALYKKLCGEPLSTRDFLELYPVTGKNLRKMMDYEGMDFEEVFSLNFEISYSNAWGTKIHKRELREGGSSIPVTRENRNEYARLWMDFHMNQAIAISFDVFLNGFKKVVKSDAFQLFNSEEVEQLLCGSHETDLDVDTLRSITKYGGGILRSSSVVEWFWEIFVEFNGDQKRKLLEFVTGSDRIPATGISTIPFKISRLGSDSDRLPLAHTCFNELCVYEYSSRSKLHQKLLIAINESEGYGFR
ncbi:LANO_0G16468g1_1 [Lachancea nothofagi CBS 11611]|uniref:HECT-type E3 ubiquitin transferase n=1 Tax=Lachancea nothofagi CBS 11611 TaxID=1266666 RepID=A0A1G4KKB9_9SACH|nr:LANO_0G16468g1_1 [Lachancea nothofagi CBS 11611]